MAVLGSLLSSGPAIGKRSGEQAELDAASVSGSDPHCVSTADLMPSYVLSHFQVQWAEQHLDLRSTKVEALQWKVGGGQP